eukprot:717521-Rhodomonas_salina.1
MRASEPGFRRYPGTRVPGTRACHFHKFQCSSVPLADWYPGTPGRNSYPGTTCTGSHTRMRSFVLLAVLIHSVPWVPGYPGTPSEDL